MNKDNDLNIQVGNIDNIDFDNEQINEESLKGSQFNFVENDLRSLDEEPTPEDETLETGDNQEQDQNSSQDLNSLSKKDQLKKDINMEIKRRHKEIELQKELKKSIELKKIRGERNKKTFLYFATSILVILVLCFLAINLIKKPLDDKYNIMYLYELSAMNVKQETNANKSFITLMNIAEDEGKDLVETSQRLYDDLGLQRIYESTQKSIEVQQDSLEIYNSGLSKRAKILHTLAKDYFNAISDLNELLVDMKNMTYDEYKQEYILRLQKVTNLQLELSEAFNDKNILGF